ncbi:MAG: hypothetical protein HGB10_09660 [Coriobacteriia bacterium]|nr:hypothetical protein [Coriobacteriia bacterium]
MPYTITYLEDEAVVFTDYEPPTSLAELEQVVADNFRIASEKGSWLFLGDCTKLPSSGSVIDVYELGETLDRIGADFRMREALVVTPDPDERGDFEFFVTVTTNRGIVVRLFTTMEEAREWLAAERKVLGF